MKTTLKNSPTKERLLDAAKDLVLAKGFAGTTVDDICQAAKLTKGSFFHYFTSKDELGVDLLKRYCASSREAFLAGCCQGQEDPLKRVYGFLDFMIEMGKKNARKGCLLGHMSQELSDTHPDIRSICCKSFREMAEVLRRDLKEAKAKYAPRSAIDPQSLAEHFVVVLEGTMLVAKVMPKAAGKGNGLHHYKQYLKALFGR